MVRILQETSHYRPPPLARIFHAFPHLNVSLHLVNSTFAPDSELYRESIGILGSIPGAWLILSLFLLLVYLLTRCCDRKPRPKHSIIVLKWTLAIFAVLCCASVGVSLYGNDDVHNGFVQFISYALNVNDKVEKIQNQTRFIENALESSIPRLMVSLIDVFDTGVHNQTARSILFTEITLFNESINSSLISCKDVSLPLKNLDLMYYIQLINYAETIRWPATMGVLSALLMFCVVLLFGVIKHSRCALIMFSVVGLFAVIVSFLMSSVYLALSVATGDFCMAPDTYVEREAPAAMQSDILGYYIACQNNRSNPFSMVIVKGTASVKEMSHHFGTITRIAGDLYDRSRIYPQIDMINTEVKRVLDKMSTLASILDCRPLHQEYRRMLLAVCDHGLFGLALMLAASFVSGLFFTILVWLDSHTWIYIRRKRDVSANGGSNMRSGLHPIGTISNQRLANESNQYATLNRKFRTLDHPGRSTAAGRHAVSFDNTVGASYTLGHRKQSRDTTGPQYSTLSRKCKTLEANDFY